MKWYYNENSDSVFISPGLITDANEYYYSHEIGECITGTLLEIKVLLEKEEGFLSAFELKDLFNTKLLRFMTEKDVMIKILDTLIKVSEAKGAGSATLKRNMIRDTNLLVSSNEGSLGTLFEFVLRVALDSMWVTHINTISLSSVVEFGNVDFSFFDIIGELMAVKAVNKELREKVALYVNAYPKEYREILGKIITKRINIGVGVKEVNKALGKLLITDVEIMKADSDFNIVKKWFDDGEEVWAEMKYDGIRGFAEMDMKGVKSIKTYNMSELDIDYMTNITEQLNRIHPVWIHFIHEPRYFFDFEITGKERQAVSGEVNKLIKGTAEKGCDKNWVANIFDVHTWDVFDGRISEVPYTKRRKILEGCVERTEGELPNILVAERWKVSNMEELMSLFSKVLEQGCEGLVVKKGTGVYEMKRSQNWVKMKAERECDLMITSWFKGAAGTKRENTIGGFVCTSSDGKVLVSVGSGFKDKDLEEIMKNGPDSYIGKIAKVRYNEVIRNKYSDIVSLFLPRFICIRFDKNDANSFEYIVKK